MRDFKSLELTQQHPFIRKFFLITSVIIFIFFLLLLLPWQQTVLGIGTLRALDPIQRDYRIAATVDGFLEEIYVRENAFVKKGDKLFKMVDLDNNYAFRLQSIQEKSYQKYENIKKQIENLNQNLQNQKDQYNSGLEIYDKQLLQLKNSLHALSEQKSFLKNQLQIEKINFHRYEALYKDGIKSTRELELSKSKYFQSNYKYESILKDIKNIKNEQTIMKERKKQFKNSSFIKVNNIKNKLLLAKNSAKTLKQNIEKESSTLSRYINRVVVAKADGYVTRIYQNDKNRIIKKGEDILYFSPIVKQKSILLKISDFNMPLIKKRLKTRIMFYGWPALQISGWPKISHGTYGGIIYSIERSSYEKGLYYALIVEDKNDTNWPDSNFLKIGSQAKVWVRLQTVPIWYEIWRILASQPPNMLNRPEEDFK